jgi:hypothetical protein
MMKNNIYALVLKTGDAEIRALENLNVDKQFIFPIIELTRGRRSKNEQVGFIKKRLDKIRNIFKGQNICLDLTTSTSLSNEEIEDLYLCHDGYKNWTNFLYSIKGENIFKNITPTILVDINDSDFEFNLKKQVEIITQNFNSILYRNSLADDGCYEDIDIVKDILIESGRKFYFLIDCEFIAPGAWKSFADKAKIRIEKIKALIEDTQFIIASTSFPNNISEFGKDDKDVFRLNEIDLHKDVSTQLNSSSILYGDYASINPIRNDDVVMSRGWIPRIDVALPSEIFYRRERRGIRDYSSTYTVIARKIKSDIKFPNNLSSNWGVKQITSCSVGNSPGSNPSFWISVRMNMHIEQQVGRLKK